MLLRWLTLPAVPVAIAWPWSDQSWFVDVAASFAAQAALWLGLCGLLAIVMRAWRLATLAVVALAVAMGGLAPGRHWTSQTPRPTPADATGDPARPAALRVMVWNIHPLNGDIPALGALLAREAPDVVCLVEAGVALRNRLPQNAGIAEQYPYRTPLQPGVLHRTVVLSRWPLSPADGGSGEGVATLEEAELEAFGRERRWALERWELRVDRPGGAVIVCVAHPQSPRTEQRWRSGLEKGRILAARAADLHARLGLPVLVALDLNGSPASARGRALRAVGLRPAKPLLTAAGTFPSWLAWPGQLGLDDAWITPDVRVAGWRTLEQPGSDHRPVVMELDVPPAG